MRSSRTLLPAFMLGCLFSWSLYGQGLTPEDAAKRMQVAEGLEVRLVASEPLVRQPVTMSFDDRGRLWVIQYLQYPNPEGLKPVKVDQYLRTVYDRLPEPPPKGPRGADRITILEDPDESGRFRKAKDFVIGLNLASGMALGHGGVFVAQPPYLLFYADKNRDDQPDGDPEVLLTGFGMEDAHAFPNSLQWGPDGWLYGAQGSTVTASIRGITFQQGIWRYHPLTREFELFAEGGGNTWGVDFDRHGNLICGTNFGNFTMIHQVQGAYYVKNFGKHGELQNPHAYGYFDHVPYQGFKGGHVTNGGIVYQGDLLPAKYRNQYIAGNLLANSLYWHHIESRGSSFTGRFGGDVLIANDARFRPVDCLTGPDGAMYVADWYDQRATHLDPRDNWEKHTGRIYKLLPAGLQSRPTPLLGGGKPSQTGRSLNDVPSGELVQLLQHPNDWYVREARRILAERRDPSVVPTLKKLIETRSDQLALQALWALYVSGGFDGTMAGSLLGHANPDVRTWTIRLLCDTRKLSPTQAAALVEIARTDASPTVRSQLACSAKRLPGSQGLPIVIELLRRQEDVQDPHIPLLLWWALEDKAVSDRQQVLAMFAEPTTWRQPLVERTITERIGRRYMAEGSEADLEACVQLLARAPAPTDVAMLIRGMDKALEGRRLNAVPSALQQRIADLWLRQPTDLTITRLALRLGNQAAFAQTLARLADMKTTEGDRLGLLEVLGQIADTASVPTLLLMLDAKYSKSVRSAAFTALQPFQAPEIAERVLTIYPTLPADLRGRALSLLCSRPTTTLALLRTVDGGTLPPQEIPLDQLRRVLLHGDKEIQGLVEKHWGKVGQATAGEKITLQRSIADTLNKRAGDSKNGKLLFTKHCGACHMLFGEGGKVGPDLTGADRKNRQQLLTDIIDPSSLIRKEYVPQKVLTTDGRLLTGLVAEATPKTVTLIDAKAERVLLARENIAEMQPSTVSVMPDKLLDPLTPQELCDLFAYLQSNPK